MLQLRHSKQKFFIVRLDALLGGYRTRKRPLKVDSLLDGEGVDGLRLASVMQVRTDYRTSRWIISMLLKLRQART